MSGISTAFRDSKRKALITYITVGYPTMESTIEAASILAESGCDIIELGIPFSDPLADGVTIQNATHQALLNGVTVKKCLDTARQIGAKVRIPLVFMGYLNPILHYGTEEFCAACAGAGVSGLIIPDLPPGELPALDEAAAQHKIDVIPFLAPNSSQERIRQVAAAARGFIYIVSVTGVTGVRDTVSTSLEELTEKVRAVTKVPVCIGFGISNAEQARQAARLADGIIIGSRIIQLMAEGKKSDKKLREFIQGIRQAIDTL